MPVALDGVCIAIGFWIASSLVAWKLLQRPPWKFPIFFFLSVMLVLGFVSCGVFYLYVQKNS